MLALTTKRKLLEKDQQRFSENDKEVVIRTYISANSIEPIRTYRC